jgi:alpha-L-fucosidase
MRFFCILTAFIALAMPPESTRADSTNSRASNGIPQIRKLGTIDIDICETTPLVWQSELWRFEWVRPGTHDQVGRAGCFRFRNCTTGAVTPSFGSGCQFGSAFIEEGTVYVTGTTEARNHVGMFVSRDLKTWKERTVIDDPKYGIFNTSLWKAGDDYVLAFEIDRPREEAGAPFTIRFAKSRDLQRWTITPPECNFTKDRYSAAPCLRWGEGWYYLFYLEAHNGYETRVVRSRDLVHWEASPLNPVLRASDEDKVIASPNLTAAQRKSIAGAQDINNSDLDFCEWHGQLVLNYSWGNQTGIEFLAEAIYNGTQDEFLRSWFPQR